jgi:putative oxidoreductase
MNTYDDAGKLLLRLMLGILILFHGVSKITHGISGVEAMVNGHGWPTFIAYLVYIGEVVAPIFLIVGLFTRIAGLIVSINMLFAFVLVHSHQFFMINNAGGWQLELQGMYFLTGIIIALLGAGRYSLGGVNGRFN